MSRSTHDHVAVDTNIIVRLLTFDDPDQAARSRVLFKNNRILIITTVILETEWVLRRSYHFSRFDMLEAFYELFGMKQVMLAQPELIAQALIGYEEGLDFADALHLAAASSCKLFATFDRKFAQKAGSITGTINIIEP